MSKNIDQVYTANPITSNAGTDLMYFGQSPYGPGDDAAMLYSNFAAQFGAPFTPAALTEVSDTNVTLTLGGTPATSLLQATSITAGWSGTLSGARGGTGVANTGSTITIGGNFAMSGAFAFTGTLTNTTGVTFPTSGTLATTTNLNSYLLLAGGTMSGNIAMGTNAITGMANPVNSQDAATKSYVDTIATGGGQPCFCATTASLTVTQAGAGVGATLTNAGAQAAFSVDGQTPSVGARVMVKNQSGGANTQNGIYTLTVAGSGATNWVLTRAIDYDTPSDINDTGLIPIINGTVNASTGWYNTTVMVTVDVTAITFVQFTNISYPISLANGGLNNNNTASAGGIFWSDSTKGNILAGTSTAGLALLSGNAATPTWSTAPPITKINIVYIISTGTYSPSAGTKFIDTQIVGDGGGSGGVTGAGGQSAASAGGGGGGYCRRLYTIAQLGASAAVVIGTGGTAGSAGNNSGGTGSGSSFTPAGAGSVLTANGGVGGGGGIATATTNNSGSAGSGGTATGGDLNLSGGNGSIGTIVLGTAPVFVRGVGGQSYFGMQNVDYSSSGGALAGGNFGQGAAGYVNFTGSNQAGSTGGPGFCLITEYIST